MAKDKSAESKPTDNSLYPHLEAFAETATGDDIVGVFGPLKALLETLKGPNKAKAAKVSEAVEETEKVLSYLLEVRARLQKEAKGGR